MNKILLWIGLAAVTLSGCEISTYPFASFSADKTTVFVGELIHFDNDSDYAYEYEWDFGDGYYAYNKNVTHAYDVPGTYKVTLAAFGSADEVDYAHMDIVVVPNCTLQVHVREYRDAGYEPYLSDVQVTIYASERDYIDEVNPIISGYTDRNGVIEFVGLDERVYWIDASNSEYFNYELFLTDPNYVRTTRLTADVVNVFEAYVQYAPVQMKSSIKGRNKDARTKPSPAVPMKYKQQKENKPIPK